MIQNKYLSALNEQQLGLLEQYYQMILKTNAHTNLTAITERDEVYLKHFADSLAALPFFFPNAIKNCVGEENDELQMTNDEWLSREAKTNQGVESRDVLEKFKSESTLNSSFVIRHSSLTDIQDAERILDIGCGAGFPSIPLKIANPDLQFTLIDSVNKKVRFVKEVIDALSLSGITVLHTRIEDFKQKNFDFVVARAVAHLSTLAEYSLPFLRVGGRLIAYKADDCDAELIASAHALKVLGGQIEKVVRIPLATDLTRKLIVVQKITKTPGLYPRGKNQPRTNPIL